MLSTGRRNRLPVWSTGSAGRPGTRIPAKTAATTATSRIHRSGSSNN